MLFTEHRGVRFGYSHDPADVVSAVLQSTNEGLLFPTRALLDFVDEYRRRVLGAGAQDPAVANLERELADERVHML